MTDLTTLIEFAEAYGRLGWAVQEQLRELVSLDSRGSDLNPEAVRLMETLYPNLADVDPELEDELRARIEEYQEEQR